MQELEHPEDAIPAVELYAPYAGAGPSTMGSTSVGHASSHGPSGVYISMSVDQFVLTPLLGGATDPARVDSEADAHARRA